MATDSDDDGIGTLTGPGGAEIADQTPEGTTWDTAETFTFDVSSGIHVDSNTDSTLVAAIDAGETLSYDGKVKEDTYYWLRYEDPTTGQTLFVPYGSITPFEYYGTDSNPGDPVYSSPAETTTTIIEDLKISGAKYRLLGLPSGQAVQKCFITPDNTAYAIQINQAKKTNYNDYVTRGTVNSSNNTINFESKHMTLERFGHCQTLDAYEHNGKSYLWIATDGKNTDNERDASGNYIHWDTQLGRLEYDTTKPVSSFKKVTRLSELIRANRNGKDVGTLRRAESAVSADGHTLLIMAITTKDEVYFTYYDFDKLNDVLDQYDGATTNFVSCKDEKIKSLAHDWGTSFKLATMLKSSHSIQGLAFDTAKGSDNTYRPNNIFISSGGQNKGAYIARASWGGTFQQKPVAPAGQTKNWTKGPVEIEGLQLSGGEINVTVTGHFKPNKSYVYSFPKSQF